MSIPPGIPKGAAVAINDLVDYGAKIKPGQEVLILAQIDGLYGGDNLVDQEAISWIQSAIQMRGANASILWIDEPATIHKWRFPPVVKAAMGGCDVLINNSFDLTFEENVELKQYLWEKKKPVMVRNFATTAPLLCTNWAQTPQELVNEIRYQAAVPIKPGLNFQITDDNGTHLEGKTLSAFNPNRPWLTDYTLRREEYSQFRPWPEYMHPPIRFENVQGVFVFDCMLSWWSRYIGISPYFNKAIRLTIENSRIKKIEGGDEADALSRFLADLKERQGEGAYDFNCLHFGINPQASVAPHQCPNPIVRRLIDHSHSSNIHAHIGVPEATDSYPYWVHVTGDIRKATFKVGDSLIHDRGHLTALDHPAVKSIAAKYPGRPGLEPSPRSY